MRQRGTSRIQLVLALIVSALLTVLVGCDGDQPAVGSNNAPQISANFVVSYVDAAGRLSGLAADEAQDQIRDWAMIGLAAHLRLATPQLRDTAYDVDPIRDPGLADLSRQATGPGRSLYDGNGVLHLLVPTGDPDEHHTIGLLLDQYRTDHGADTPQVQVHHYQINTSADTVAIVAGPVTPTENVRASNGYLTMEVDNDAQLSTFLTKTSYLSRLEVRGNQIWASGWTWPAPADARVTDADVSVLQRGYLTSDSTHRPGFSLDPQNITNSADLLAVVPGLDPTLADSIINNDWTNSGYTSAEQLQQIVEEQLYQGDVPASELAADGVPSDRTQLWALDAQLTNQWVYSKPRYDGDLAGTEVGMTLEYTDFVTKNWVNGVGSGVPTNAVPGFVPDDLATTPWNECTADNTKPTETGRLWFGEDPAAVGFGQQSVDLGAQATELFFRSNGDNGAEVQPSYSFGRGMTWWEAHYAEVAAYDAEYQRLDDIMRWSDALDWLVNKSSARLPQLADAQIPSNLRFSDWYAQHQELKERAPIEFVNPPSANSDTQSMLPLPTPPFGQCGGQVIEGGVSLGDLIDRESGHDYGPNLPPAVGRAGLVESDSNFDQNTGRGAIIEDTLDDQGHVTDKLLREFSGTGDHADIKTTGGGRRVNEFAGFNLDRTATASRRVDLRIDRTVNCGVTLADCLKFAEFLSLDGQLVGTLSATAIGGQVDIRWQPGIVDRTVQALRSIQSRFQANPTGGIPPGGDGVLASYTTPDGQILYDVAGADQPWLKVTDKVPPAGDDLVIQVGEPNPNGEGANFLAGMFVPPPKFGDGDWLRVTPGGDANHAATLVPGTGPKPKDPSIRVTTRDNKQATIYLVNDVATVKASDPILGPTGRPEGMALLDALTTIRNVMRLAKQAGDGLLRGVQLDGDGVALVGADQVYLSDMDSQWADRVLRGAAEFPGQVPLLRLEGGLAKDGQAVTVDTRDLGQPTSTRVTDFGSATRIPGATVYLNDAFRSSLTLQQGPVIAAVLAHDTRVSVRTYTKQEVSATHADQLQFGGGKWWRADDFTGVPRPPVQVTTTATPPPSGAPGSGAAQPPAGPVIVLVCPANTAGVAGC